MILLTGSEKKVVVFERGSMEMNIPRFHIRGEKLLGRNQSSHQAAQGPGLLQICV